MSPRYTLICCILIHTQALVRNDWLIAGTREEEQRLLDVFQGLTFLLYPLCGWIAEVCFSSFRMVQLSFLTATLGCALMAINGIAVMLKSIEYTNGSSFATISIVSVVTISIGLGMFEANAIQSAMEEMLEESSEQLSSFIHWYFWCSNFGPLVVLYCVVGGTFSMFDCHVDSTNLQYYSGLAIVSLSAPQIPFQLLGFIFTIKGHSSLYGEPAKRNSLKIIFRVLKYSYQHKYPEKRSAFTYWENDVPSRIDLGKEKYGGPFTYEQVEDVKTFFRLLLLILSLFGFHLMGNTYSLTYYIMNTFGCPTAATLGLIIGNPKHFPLLVTVIGIPVFQYMKKYFHYFIPNMLTRLSLGLVLSLVTQTSEILYTIMLNESNHEFQCPEVKNLSFGNSTIMKCLLANMKLAKNNECIPFCSDRPIDENLSIVYLSIIPLTLYGISYLMIFTTTLEFICAQSPNAVKGLLIGIWYSMLTLTYIINALDTYPPLLDMRSWNIYNGAKGLGIFLSIVMFSLVHKNYHYRERNEIVNEQAIIEEQYERELLMNESDDIYSTDEY